MVENILELGGKNKCVMILSDKSSGSSILQQELLKNENVHIVNNTRHFEQETLFWNKAVAVLGLPQEPMKFSELPMSREFARTDLIAFLEDNIPGFSCEELDKDSIFMAWQQLCLKFGPVFLEKSPQHLHYIEALKLIIEMMKRSEVECYFIGLVRNPMDTLYSSWQRWSADPEINQHEWQRAYSNLLKFRGMAPDRTKIVRYEELMSDKETILGICEFLGIDSEKGEVGKGFHSKSIQRWRSDRFFTFEISESAKALAHKFGYREPELSNASKCPWLWTLYMPVHGFYLKVLRMKRRLQNKW